MIPILSSLHPHLQWWLDEDNVLSGQPLHPIRHALQLFTDASKEGWGAHLNEYTARGVWSLPESKLHIKGGLPSLERISRPLHQQHSSGHQRQHYSSVIHKQRRGYEVGPSMCPTMEDLDLVYQKTSDSQSPTYSGPVERGGRQAIPSRPDYSNRMVPPSRGLPDHMLQVAPAPDRPICNEVQQQVTSVCVTSTGYPGSSSGCSQSAMGGSGCICLPTSSNIGQSGGEVARLPMQKNHSDCSGVAQHALVLGSSRYVQPNPTEPAQSARPVDTTLQSDSSQNSDKS